MSRVYASISLLAISLIAVVFAMNPLSGLRDARAATWTSPNLYLGDVGYSNYGYHYLYLSWTDWNGNYTAVYSSYKTTMVSPSSGYHYDTWYHERTDGPYFGGSYVTLADSGATYIDYYSNNPHFLNRNWGYGLNNQILMASTCPSFWCRAALWYWGAYIKAQIAALSSTAQLTQSGH